MFESVLPAHEWRRRAESHEQRVGRITGPIRDRRARGKKHPVLDFLVAYYPYSLRKLEEWHPGFGVALESGPQAMERYATSPYTYTEMLHTLDPAHLVAKQRDRLGWIRALLVATRDRPPNFACHGMHEWAMVYGGADIRHDGTVPLRLAQEEIDALVETRPICCSHFDAFRFFAPDSKALNKLQPGLWTREEHEQAGCLHANMDLYKWAFKSMPWVGSDLLADAFELAIAIREIDMRASPYDLSSFGYEPIRIETAEGRREYEAHQRTFVQRAAPLRQGLITALDKVLSFRQNDGAAGSGGAQETGANRPRPGQQRDAGSLTEQAFNKDDTVSPPEDWGQSSLPKI